MSLTQSGLRFRNSMSQINCAIVTEWFHWHCSGFAACGQTVRPGAYMPQQAPSDSHGNKLKYLPSLIPSRLESVGFGQAFQGALPPGLGYTDSVGNLNEVASQRPARNL